MVSAFPMQPFYRQAPLAVDTAQAQKYFDEDGSILDDNVLDQAGLDSGLEMSPPMPGSRRESFAVSSSLFSPKSEDWQSVEMQSVPSNNSFLDQHGSNPFTHLDQSQDATQASAFASQGHWSLSNSGSATPLQHFDGLPATFDANPPSAVFQRATPMQGQTPFSNPGNQVSVFSSLPGSHSIPTSPQKDSWAGQEHVMAKRNRLNSPGLLRTHNELRKGDGIRKKNARFDIPAERNLSNIDQLIAQSTDETEIKELKQQKRLLRNRQAALDSRQRKKQHTERLEDEKKQYTAVISELEMDLDETKRTMEEMKQQYCAMIEALKFDNEELIRSHTIETGELRKKISVLTSHVQAVESAAMSNQPAVSNPVGFSDSFGDMDAMNMDSGNWGNVSFLNDFPMEQPPQQPQMSMPHHLEVKSEMQLAADAKRQADAGLSEAEKPQSQGGLLFMLFLVGAFVLSSRSPPSIPPVSEDVRTASATLLENVLKEHGVSHTTSATALGAMAPLPSGGSSWASAPAAAGAPNAMDGVTPSMLGGLTDAFAQPTQEQVNEQLFSLSAAQYNGVVGGPHDFLPHGDPSTSMGRRNLAEALATMRSSGKQSAAEVYTRSLLWDQIPSDVVRSFAKMVAECNGQGNSGDRRMPNSE